MDFVTVDFETAYDKEYSLSKMQTDEYVLDDRFQVIMCGIRHEDGRGEVVFDRDPLALAVKMQAAVDWKNTVVCCHHAHFDGFIMTQRLGIKPKMWLDTLSMGRTLYPWLPSHSLNALAKELGLGRKGDAVHNVQGMWLRHFAGNLFREYADYCMNDVMLTYKMAKLMLERLPVSELLYIDMTVRMFTEPKFIGDVGKLKEYLRSERARKADLLEQVAIEKTNLMSNNRFAELLMAEGVDPPTKESPRTGKTTWAFAKSDKEFTALQDHDNPRVAALVTARLGVKSTIAETRTERMIEAAERGPMPVYLSHWGAKTTGRLSGGNKMNWQNLPKRGGAKEIRKAILAPPGHCVVVGDSSNIELRVAMTAAGEDRVVQQFRNDEDLYCDFATDIYGRTITKADEHERLVGKIAMLSLQYGSGPETFMEMLRTMTGILLPLGEAAKIVTRYREKYDKVHAMWGKLQREILPAILNEDWFRALDANGWVVTLNEGFAIPGLPGVVYKGLHHDGENWQYTSGRGKIKLYGGKVFENFCQHVARHIVLWQTARVHQRYPVALSVHDEVVCVVPEKDAEDCKAFMEESLTLAPKWCRKHIPLACEVEIANSYGDAK